MIENAYHTESVENYQFKTLSIISDSVVRILMDFLKVFVQAREARSSRARNNT